MSRQAQILSIPKPCHENWEQMANIGLNKFCSACQHRVVDFTLLTDQQIINVLKTGNVKCGRFSNTQLQRPLTQTVQPSPFKASIKKIAASLFLFQGLANISFAQSKIVSIHGQVLDDKKEPVINAVVTIYRKSNLFSAVGITDIDGNFIIDSIEPGKYDLSCHALGYKNNFFHNVKTSSNIPISLDMEFHVTMGDIIIVRRHKPSFWQRINIFKRREHHQSDN